MICVRDYACLVRHRVQYMNQMEMFPAACVTMVTENLHRKWVEYILYGWQAVLRKVKGIGCGWWRWKEDVLYPASPCCTYVSFAVVERVYALQLKCLMCRSADSSEWIAYIYIFEYVTWRDVADCLVMFTVCAWRTEIKCDVNGIFALMLNTKYM